jgi:hypothetical protein
VGTSRTTYLGHAEGALPARGELVSSFSSKHPPEHQIVHLKFSAVHEPVLVAFECLEVLCIFNSKLSSSFIDEVDILASELILRGFVVYLYTYGAHGDFSREDDLSPVDHKERRLPSDLAG